MFFLQIQNSYALIKMLQALQAVCSFLYVSLSQPLDLSDLFLSDYDLFQRSAHPVWLGALRRVHGPPSDLVKDT